MSNFVTIGQFPFNFVMKCRESGFISGEPFLKEGETEEDATEVN